MAAYCARLTRNDFPDPFFTLIDNRTVGLIWSILTPSSLAITDYPDVAISTCITLPACVGSATAISIWPAA